MIDKLFKVGETVKHVTTGGVLTVLDVKPLGLQVFYKLEAPDGKICLVPAKFLRPCN